MAYATAEDVTTRWVGPGLPADVDQVSQLIDDAEALIAHEFPDLDDRIGTDTGPSEAVVIQVVVAMVTRIYKNPEGVRSRSDSSQGDFGASVVFSGDNPGALTITPEERGWMAAPSTGPAGLAVLATSRGPIETAPLMSDGYYGYDGGLGW